MDLSGKLIIKASLGDDIRRIPIHNEELTYDELILMMQRVFRGKLDASDDVTLKYKDEDGDLITIFDSADVACAIQFSRILKLTLFVNGMSSVGGGGVMTCGVVAPDVKAELRAIRDRINKLLDEVSDKRPDTEGGATATASDLDALENKMAAASVQQQHNGTTESKEFDPLQRANSIGGIPDDQQSVSSQSQAEQQPQALQPLQPPPSQAAMPPLQQHAQVPPDVQQVPQQVPQVQQVGPPQAGAYQPQPQHQQLPGAMPQPARPPPSAMYPQPGYQRPPGPATAPSPRPAYPNPAGAPQAMPPRMTQSPVVQQQPASVAPPASQAYRAPVQAVAPASSAYQGYQGYSPQPPQQQQPQQQQQWQGNQQQQQQPPASAYQPGAATMAPPISAPSPGAPPAGPPVGGANPYAKAPGQNFYR